MALQLEPLPGDVVELLLRGATQLEPSAHTRQRLRERLAVIVPQPGGSRTLALVPLSGLKDVATAAVRSRWLIGALSFLSGMGAASTLRPKAPAIPVAAAVAHVPEPQSPAVLELPRVVPTLAPASVPAAVVPRDRRPGAPGVFHSPAASVPSHPTAPAKPILQIEGELLERGRIAMLRGDADGALAAVDEHLSRFPDGALVEEREALRIQALVAGDRDPEAREALSAFERRYPQSLVGPALRAAAGR